MAEEAVCVGVDVAKSTLEVAVSDSAVTRQFANDDEGIPQAVRYIAGLKPAGVILEATGHLEMPLAAALQASRLPVAVINPRQVRDWCPSKDRCHGRPDTGSLRCPGEAGDKGSAGQEGPRDGEPSDTPSPAR